MLIAFSGLPGSGKSTIAKLLAARLRCAYLRIDSIEQAILRSGSTVSIGLEGYAVAQAVAEDSLRAGASVVVDAVNAQPISRDAWSELAHRLGVRFLAVGVQCSDRDEHRRRVESRTAEIESHVLPTWAEVTSRGFAPFGPETLIIDTALETALEAVDRIVLRLS